VQEFKRAAKRQLKFAKEFSNIGLKVNQID